MKSKGGIVTLKPVLWFSYGRKLMVCILPLPLYAFSIIRLVKRFVKFMSFPESYLINSANVPSSFFVSSNRFFLFDGDRHRTYPSLANYIVHILSIPPIEKIRNHLVASPIHSHSSCRSLPWIRICYILFQGSWA